MAKPSSAKTRRRTNKVRRTQSRRGGGPKGPNASYWNAYGAPYLPSIIRSSSSMFPTLSHGGPPTRAHAIKKLDKHLIKLAAQLEAAGRNPVDIPDELNTARQHGLAIIDHNYPPTSSRFGNMMASMSGIFKPHRDAHRDAVYTNHHPDRYDNLYKIMQGLNRRGIEELKQVFTEDRQNITKITKNSNGDILIHFKDSHPGLGRRASMMIPAGK